MAAAATQERGVTRRGLLADAMAAAAVETRATTAVDPREAGVACARALVAPAVIPARQRALGPLAPRAAPALVARAAGSGAAASAVTIAAVHACVAAATQGARARPAPRCARRRACVGACDGAYLRACVGASVAFVLAVNALAGREHRSGHVQRRAALVLAVGAAPPVLAHARTALAARAAAVAAARTHGRALTGLPD